MQTQYIPIEDLKPYPRNNRKHPEAQLKHIEESIRRFGFNQPVVVDGKNEIIIGHARVEAARRAGMDAVPTLLKTDLTPEEIRAYRIIDNKTASEAEWDFDNLQFEVSDLYESGFDVDTFALDELLEGIDSDNGEVTEDDYSEPDHIETKIQLGDLIELGPHRVLCGDTQDRDNHKRLMDGSIADLGITSPPYAVGKEYEKDVDFAAHLTLLQAMADRALECIKAGGFFFVNFDEIAAQSHAGPLTGSKRQCLYPISKDYWRIFHDERGCDLYAQRIWYKPFNRLQQPFWTYKTSIPHYQEWEHIWTWRLPGGRGDKCFDWDISGRAVWDTRDESTDDRPLTRHCAAFPVGIPGRAIKAHSARGALIWEPFLGSGTTLIAADQLNRVCYGIEIEPKYCQVIIDRYYKYCMDRQKEFVCTVNGDPYFG